MNEQVTEMPVADQGANHLVKVSIELGDETEDGFIEGPPGEIPVQQLKADILHEFGRGSPLEETMPYTDEDTGWTWDAVDHRGSSVMLPEQGTVDLARFREIHVTPSTTLGGAAPAGR